MLRDYDIYTTMNIVPSIPAGLNTKIVITRGASASLTFNLAEKVYDFNSIDQLTYLLKQGSRLYWYKLFTYLIPSEDTQIDPAKTYFSNVSTLSTETFQATGEVVLNPEGNPKEKNYYEVVEDNHSWRDTYYIIDEHFYYYTGEGCNYVSLLLSSKETTLLSTQDIQCEVAIRLNTDIFASLKNADSIIIEPQNNISVVDSLYSQIGG